MIQCPKCKERSYAQLTLTTEVNYGHGDSTFKCFVVCKTCGTQGKAVTDWGNMPTREDLHKAWIEFETEV